MILRSSFRSLVPAPLAAVSPFRPWPADCFVCWLRCLCKLPYASSACAKYQLIQAWEASITSHHGRTCIAALLLLLLLLLLLHVLLCILFVASSACVPVCALQTKKFYKLVKKAAKDKIARRGVKEVKYSPKPPCRGLRRTRCVVPFGLIAIPIVGRW